MQSFFIVLTWILFGIICSKIASKKNRNQISWFFLGLFLGLIALLIICFLKPIRVNEPILNENQPFAINYPPILKSDNNYWYYLDTNKKQIGPMSIKKIIDTFFEGIITHDTFVWNDTMCDWIKLKETELFSKILNQK